MRTILISAFSQFLSVNSFRWRIRGERAGNTFSHGPRNPKRFGLEEKWGLGTRQVFDNFMTWKAHADLWSVKRVSILGRVRSFVTKEAATLDHNALILPLFYYCDIAWSNLLQQDIDRLQRLQNRSARIITRCSRSSEAIEQLHWPTLSSRRSNHKAKLVFNCLHSLVPSYFSLYFTIFSNIHNYSARQSMRLSLPNVKQNFGKRTWRKNSPKRRTSCE